MSSGFISDLNLNREGNDKCEEALSVYGKSALCLKTFVSLRGMGGNSVKIVLPPF